MNTIENGIDRIEKHGWTQGTFREPFHGGFCMLGAIGAVDTLFNDVMQVTWDEYANAQHAIEVELATRGFDQSVDHYNDTPGRTVDEVIDVMKYASKRLDSGS